MKLYPLYVFASGKDFKAAVSRQSVGGSDWWVQISLWRDGSHTTISDYARSYRAALERAETEIGQGRLEWKATLSGANVGPYTIEVQTEEFWGEGDRYRVSVEGDFADRASLEAALDAFAKVIKSSR